MLQDHEILDVNELNFLLQRISEYELNPEDTIDLKEFLNKIKVKQELTSP